MFEKILFKKKPINLKRIQVRRNFQFKPHPKMKYYIEVLSNGQNLITTNKKLNLYNFDQPNFVVGSSCVSIIYEGYSLFFNFPESSQRLLTELKPTKITKISDVFFTRLNWDCVGGIVGKQFSII